MIADFHFLRPWWLLALVPFVVLAWQLWRRNPHLESWAAVCDKHLLDHLAQGKNGSKTRHQALAALFFSLFFLIISLAGPAWSRLPVPSYKPIEPRVFILDMSETMLAKDLSPNRLTRAKFKLHDLLSRDDLGQSGLMVFTGEPFIVSPLTEDAKTIDALLPSLTPEIMPVSGQKLSSALTQAATMITQAGYNQGQLLVFTAKPPSEAAIQEAAQLAQKGIYTSVMPVIADQANNTAFTTLAKAGEGMVLPFIGQEDSIQPWLKGSVKHQYSLNALYQIPVWRDEGRWFLIPAMIGLLPTFRRGWLQRIDT